MTDEQTPAPMPSSVPPPPVTWAPPSVEPKAAGFSWGDFFSFRYMITPVVIKVIYIIGAALITLAALASMVSGGGNLVVGLLTLLFGNLYWRVITELLIVFFGMHESLRTIEREGRR